jgi:hypothetical protein
MRSVAFPPIRGSLTVNTRVKDPNTWEIDFDYTVGTFAGLPVLLIVLIRV